MKLQTAIRIAVNAHDGQLDKGDLPYILHPWRVMEAVRPLGEDAMVAAILHDVFEDTKHEILPTGTIYNYGATGEARHAPLGHLSIIQEQAVDALTRRPGEQYSHYVQRCGQNGIARAVKLADLRDNTEPWRAAGLSDSGRKRYLTAMKTLQEMER